MLSAFTRWLTWIMVMLFFNFLLLFSLLSRSCKLNKLSTFCQSQFSQSILHPSVSIKRNSFSSLRVIEGSVHILMMKERPVLCVFEYAWFCQRQPFCSLTHELILVMMYNNCQIIFTVPPLHMQQYISLGCFHIECMTSGQVITQRKMSLHCIQVSTFFIFLPKF